MTDAIRDSNFIPVALGQSSTNAAVTLPFKVDPITGRLLTDTSGGSGSPGGNDTDIQFNDNGSFGGEDTFRFDSADNTVYLGEEGSGNGGTLAGVPATTNNTAGGFMVVEAGNGKGNGVGGELDLYGGSGDTTGNGGRVVISAGGGGAASGNGGNVEVTAGSSNNGNGGDLILFSGAGTGAAGVGGDAELLADNGSGSGAGGDISVAAGQGGATGNGGFAELMAGPGGATSGAGGALTLEGGSGGSLSGNGGDVDINGGDAGLVGSGGEINITGGGAQSGEIGGNINLIPSLAGVSYSGHITMGVNGLPTNATGGHVIIGNCAGTPTGVPQGSWTDGAIIVDETNNLLYFYSSGAWRKTNTGSSLTVGTTVISGGANTRILYDNSGVLGEYTLTGTGTVAVMQTAPTFATSITTPSVLATANDSGALGAAGTAFSDLFLAEGGVINWDSSDVTLTQTGNVLALAGITTFSLDGNISFLTTGAAGTRTISVATQSASNTDGDILQMTGAAGNGSGQGGGVKLTGGAGGATGAGGGISLLATGGGATSGNAGSVIIQGGAGTTEGNGGSITLTATAGVGTNRNGGSLQFAIGAATGAGTPGSYKFIQSAGTLIGTLDFESIASTSKTFTFPNVTGNVVIDSATQTLTNKTIGAGALTLAENASIALDPAGSADGKYTGITITGTAGATLAFGQLCYLAVADSRWELADADAVATAGYVMMGMCVLAAAADGSATTMLLVGQIRADAQFPALTVGAAVYAGETAGAIQVAIPTGADNVIRVVGFALTADEIYFNPSQDHQTTVA